MSEAKIVLSAVDQTKAAFQSVKQSLESTKVSVGALHASLAGLAAGLGAVALANSVRGVIEAADHINKLSQRAGVAAETLSQLQFAAKLSDVSTDSLAGAMKKLNVSISEGLAGDKAKVEAFRNLGISLKDAAGRAITADTALLKIADSFGAAKDGATKTAYAVALMGKAGDEMIPMLNGGGAAVEALMKKADRLGLTISSEFARKAEEFNDNLTVLKASSDRLAVSLAGDLVNGMGTVARTMADASESGGKLRGLMAGLNELANQMFDWQGQAQRKQLSDLRGELQQARQALADMSKEWNSLSVLQRAAVPDLAAGVEKATQKMLQLQGAVAKVSQEYFRFSDAAGAGRGVARDPRVLGPVGSVAQQTDLKPLGGGAGGSASEYDALIKRIKERIALGGEELRVGHELTDYEKFAAKVSADLDLVKKELTATQRAYVEQLLAGAKAGDLELQVMRSQAEAAKQVAQARQQARNTDYDQSSSAVRDIFSDQGRALAEVRDRVTVMKDEREAILLAAKANISLAEATERVALARANERRERFVEGSEGEEAVKREIEQREKLLQLVGERAQFDKQREMWESIDRTAHDVFTNIFEDGSNAFKRLGQTLKAAVLDLLYQLTVKRWIINIAANMTGTSQGSLMGGGVGFGGVGNLGSLGSFGNLGSIAQVGSQFIGGSMSAANAAGTLAANAAGTGLDGLLATNAAYGTAAAGSSAAGATGAMGALGSIPVAGWIAMAAASDYFMGKKAGLPAWATVLLPGSGLAARLLGVKPRGGPKAEGYYNPYNADRYYSSNSPEVMGVAKTGAGAVQAQYDDFNKTFGGTAGLQFGLGFSTDPKGKAPTMAHIGAGRGGSTLFNVHREDIGRDQEDLQKAIAEMGAQAVLKGLQQSNIAGILGDYLASIGDAAELAADKVSEALARLQKAAGEKQALDETWYQMTHSAAEILARQRQKELDALDISNRAQAIRIYGLQDEIAKQQQVRQMYAEVSAELAQLRMNLGGYLDKLNATPAGLLPPEQQLANARAQFDRQLVAARGGDRNAMQGLTGYADQLISAQQAYTASGMPTQDTIAYVKDRLSALPGQLNAEEFVANAVQDGSYLLNATLEQLIAHVDAGSAAQIAAIMKQADADNQALAQQTAARASAAAAAAAATAQAKSTAYLEGPNWFDTTRDGLTDAQKGSIQFLLNSGNYAEMGLSRPSFEGYADGGWFGGGGRIVGERGRELEFTGPSRIFNAMQTERLLQGGGNEALAAELRGVRQQLERVATIVAAGARGTIDRLVQVADNTAASARAIALRETEAPA